MSTETRDALREALAEAMNDLLAFEGLGRHPGNAHAEAILAHPAMVAAIRAADVPVAEGLDGCEYRYVERCGKSADHWRHRQGPGNGLMRHDYFALTASEPEP